MVVLIEPKEVIGPDFNKLNSIQFVSDVDYKFTGKVGEVHILSSKDDMKTASAKHVREALQLAEFSNFPDDRKLVSGFLPSLDLELVLQSIGSSGDDTTEAFYEAGEKIGVKIREAAYDSVQLYFHTDITGEDLTAFIHRMLFNVVKNTSFKSKATEVHLPSVINVQVKKLLEFDVVQKLHEARSLAVAALFCANMVNAPYNYCNPKTYAAYIEKHFRGRSNISVKVMDEKDAAEMKMGSFLAVAQGSRFGCRLIHLTYKKGKGSRKFALVGKGITTDTGGYNIKPGNGMLWMKYDMTGSATVMAAMMALSELGIDDVEVHGIVAVTANLINEEAIVPGDIVTASNGKTIEVQNTDAEGRLVLADALVYAEKQLGGPGSGTIIDLATLTGACKVALGENICGMWSNSDNLATKIAESGTRSGESLWRMPLYAPYKKHIESVLADLRNVKMGYGLAGHISAALFLQEFISAETKWAHLDIAGVAWKDDLTLASGWGISTLIHIIRD